jgi:hypothetical protein
MYELDLRVVVGDEDLPDYALSSTDGAPHGNILYNISCTYSIL